jgi:hypothetical protein
MTRLSKKQKRELRERTAFWCAHALHWYGMAACFMVTFTTVYTYWSGDAAFSRAVIGG